VYLIRLESSERFTTLRMDSLVELSQTRRPCSITVFLFYLFSNGSFSGFLGELGSFRV
jgi:hypothetical protein